MASLPDWDDDCVGEEGKVDHLHDFEEECRARENRVGVRDFGMLILFVGYLVNEFGADEETQQTF